MATALTSTTQVFSSDAFAALDIGNPAGYIAFEHEYEYQDEHFPSVYATVFTFALVGEGSHRASGQLAWAAVYAGSNSAGNLRNVGIRCAVQAHRTPQSDVGSDGRLTETYRLTITDDDGPASVDFRITWDFRARPTVAESPEAITLSEDVVLVYGDVSRYFEDDTPAVDYGGFTLTLAGNPAAGGPSNDPIEASPSVVLDGYSATGDSKVSASMASANLTLETHNLGTTDVMITQRLRRDWLWLDPSTDNHVLQTGVSVGATAVLTVTVSDAEPIALGEIPPLFLLSGQTLEVDLSEHVLNADRFDLDSFSSTLPSAQLELGEVGGPNLQARATDQTVIREGTITVIVSDELTNTATATFDVYILPLSERPVVGSLVVSATNREVTLSRTGGHVPAIASLASDTYIQYQWRDSRGEAAHAVKVYDTDDSSSFVCDRSDDTSWILDAAIRVGGYSSPVVNSIISLPNLVGGSISSASWTRGSLHAEFSDVELRQAAITTIDGFRKGGGLRLQNLDLDLVGASHVQSVPDAAAETPNGAGSFAFDVVHPRIVADDAVSVRARLTVPLDGATGDRFAVVTLARDAAFNPPAAPPTPANLRETATAENSITWEWNASAGADDYLTSHREPGDAWSAETTVTGTSRTVTGLDAGTTYEFRVRARNAGGESSYATDEADTQDATPSPPPTPANLRETATAENSITWEWNASAGADDYLTSHREPGDAWSAETTVTGTSRTVTGLDAGTTYEFRVRASNDGGESGYATDEADTQDATPAPPPTPANLRETATAENSITWEWDASTGADDYLTSHREPGDAWSAETTVTGTSRTVTGLDAGTTYEFRVRARNAGGESSYATDEADTQDATPSPPPTPANLRETATTENSITWEWNASAGADDYLTSHREPGDAWSAETTVTGTSRTVTGLDAGTTYEFRVRARNAGGESSYATDEADTEDATPAADGNLWLAGGTPDGIYLSTDGGATWGALIPPPAGQTLANGIAVGPDGDLWLAGSSPDDIYRSADGGATWDSSGISAPAGQNVVAGISVGPDGDVWIAGNVPDGIYRSTDGGATWGALISPPAGQGGVNGIAVGPDGDVWIAGSNPDDIYRSADGGATWDSSGISAPAGQLVASGIAVGPDGDVWLAGNTPDGIYRSTDGGATWGALISPPAGQTAVSGIAFGASTVTPAAPPTPANLRETATAENSITWEWDASTGADDYLTSHREPGDAWSAETTVTGTSRTVTGLDAGTTYEFRVRARNAGGESSYATDEADTQDATPSPPPTPTNLRETATAENSITWEWNASAGADDYLTSHREPGDAWSAETTVAGTSRTVTGLDAGTTYEFRVRASNDGGESGYATDEADTQDATPSPPPTPTNLRETATTEDSITWEWDASTGADDYLTSWRLRGPGGGWSAETAVTGTSRTVTGLDAGTDYAFRVRARNAGGNSGLVRDNASTDDATPSPPPTPANLRETATTEDSITWEWNASVGADDYLTSHREPGDAWSAETTVTGTSRTVSGLDAGTTYEFRVRASNDGGQSAYATDEADTDASTITWTVELEADWYSQDVHQVQWLPVTGNRPAVPSSLVPPGTTRFVDRVGVTFSTQTTQPNQLALSFAASQTANTFIPGEDLSSLFETQGSIHLVSGSDEFTFGLAGSDTSEPYGFTHADFGAFADALGARTGNQSATLTLTVPAS